LRGKKALVSKQSAIGYTNLHRTFWRFHELLGLSSKDLLLSGFNPERIV